jgi:hypothetical protein
MSGSEEVLKFLQLLEKAPKSRPTWRVVACHCRGCGELAIEVFRTPVASMPLVAVHYGLTALDMEPGKTYPLGIKHKGVRASDPTVSVLANDIQDGLEVACKCGKRVVPAATLLSAVRGGESALVLDTPGHS